MYWVLIVLNLLISLILVAVILMQASKGDGLSSSFGGSAFGTVFGVRRTADFLQKFTIGLASAFLVICLIANMWFLPSSSGGGNRRPAVLQDIEPPAPGSLPPMQSPPLRRPHRQIKFLV